MEVSENHWQWGRSNQSFTIDSSARAREPLPSSISVSVPVSSSSMKKNRGSSCWFDHNQEEQGDIRASPISVIHSHAFSSDCNSDDQDPDHHPEFKSSNTVEKPSDSVGTIHEEPASSCSGLSRQCSSGKVVANDFDSSALSRKPTKSRRSSSRASSKSSPSVDVSRLLLLAEVAEWFEEYEGNKAGSVMVLPMDVKFPQKKVERRSKKRVFTDVSLSDREVAFAGTRVPARPSSSSRCSKRIRLQAYPNARYCDFVPH